MIAADFNTGSAIIQGNHNTVREVGNIHHQTRKNAGDTPSCWRQFV